jgi:TatD DNase family protein
MNQDDGSGPAPLVDTHAHPMDRAFDADRAEVLARARAAGLVALIAVGYTAESSRQAVALAEAHDWIWATVGIHPNAVSAASRADWAEVARLARHPRVVAIGETGLDYYRTWSQPAAQRDWLRRHLDLAGELDRPVVVHNRAADADVRAILTEWAARRAGAARPPGVLHCFAGDPETLAVGTAAGFYVSFAGPVTYRNAGRLPLAVVQTPADRLVLETDCPYLPPVPHRGQRNEPAYLRLTARRVAELRGEPPEALARRTTANAGRLFGLPLPAAAETDRSGGGGRRSADSLRPGERIQ